MAEKDQLKRVITLPLLVFYGTGTILGAGVYALIGKIVGASGIYAPFSFLLSSLIAAFVAFTYAQLSRRYPKSAGEAVYVHQAFHRNWLTALVGWGIVFTGVVSSGVMARGFYGYLNEFFPLSDVFAVGLFVLLISIIAILGIALSVGFATLVTLIEISGIILILIISREHLAGIVERGIELIPPMSWPVWRNIIFGAFLAFYAFIGFEDMVNVAEEVIEPKKNLPVAIVLALIISTFFYILVSFAALMSLPIQELADNKAPFALIVKNNSQIPVEVISLISLVAILNGALVQMVMGARVLYGLSEKRVAPSLFGKINAYTRTPIYATVFISLAVLIMALWLPIETLAKTTSFIILSIFALISLSLCVIRIAERKAQKSSFLLADWIPILSFLFCCLFVMMQFV